MKDSDGKPIEFLYIHTALKQHIIFDGDKNAKILVLFSSLSVDDIWTSGLINIHREWGQRHFISDLDSYKLNDSQRCHSLFLIGVESILRLEDQLEKKGLDTSDYNIPELIHRFKNTSIYKMNRIKDCAAKQINTAKIS